MPEGRVADDNFGSRHRAALGITEETDAVVVIVSEERGTISFCFNGNIASNLDGPKLRTMLDAIFSPKVRKKSRRKKATRDTSPGEPLPKAVPPPELEPAPSSRGIRDSEDDSSPPPRISLIAAEPEFPVAGPKSDPPPAPLRTSGQIVTPATPPASAPLRAAPVVGPAAPLRTPVTTSDAGGPPGRGDRDSQGDS